MSSLFDPYHDRTARLLRNELSEPFMADLESGLLTAVSSFIDANQGRLSAYLEYIDTRLAAYSRVVQVVEDEQVQEPLLLALDTPPKLYRLACP